MATIRDVAGEVGVSTATVSRVFNRSPRVSAETARRVWQAAMALDYWPNSAARTLTTSRTNAIGVLLPDLYGEFFSEIIRGVDQTARQQSMQVLISSSHASPIELVAAAGAMFGRVDGMIIMASDQATAEAIDRVANHFPVVLMNPAGPHNGRSEVSVDNFGGACAAVEHLLSLGHRAIALLGGPQGNSDAAQRAAGYREALRRAGIGPSADLELRGEFDERSGYVAAAELLARKARPTAVFCANDSMAVGLLGGLREAGVAVPQQIAVVGFDDIAIARYLSPPLTTVSVDVCELGRRAVRVLLASLGSEPNGGRRPAAAPAPQAGLASALAARPGGMPAGQDGLPAGQDGLPAGRDGLPAGQDGLSSGQDGLPAGQEEPLAPRKEPAAHREVLPARLVVRASCGAAGRSGVERPTT